MRSGRLPLWNWQAFGGVPLLANGQISPFSPFVLPMLCLPFFRGLALTLFAKILLAGFFTFRFARSLRLAAPAALLAAVAFALSGFFVAWLHFTLTAVAVWLPLSLHAVHWAFRDPGRVGIRALALTPCTALLLLSGHPETAAFSLCVTAAFAVHCARGRPRAEALRALGRAALAVLLGALVAAPLLLPLAEYLAHSNAPARRIPFFLPWEAAILALVPDFFGNPAGGTTFGPLNYNETAIHVGVAALALAFFAPCGRSRDTRFFLALLAGSLALAFGLPGLSHLWRSLPGLRLAAAPRLVFLAAFAGSLLAAMGLDRLFAADPPRAAARRLAFAGLFSLASLAAWTTLTWSILAGMGLRRYEAANLLRFALLSGAVASLAWLRARGTLRPRLFAPLALALVAGELLLAGFGHNPSRPVSQVFPETRATAWIAQEIHRHGWGRIAAVGDALPPNAALAYGFEDIRGYDAITPRGIETTLDRAGLLPSIIESAASVTGVSASCLGGGSPCPPPAPDKVLAVRFLRRLWDGLDDEERGVLLRLPSNMILLEDVDKATLDRLGVRFVAVKTTDARVLAHALEQGYEPGLADGGAVILESPSPAPEAAVEGGKGRAAVVRRGGNRLEIEAHLDSAGTILVNHAWWPGWRAWVDGEPADLDPDPVFGMAVEAAAGDHEVDLAFRSAAFRAGLVLAAGAGAVWILLLAVGLGRDIWKVLYSKVPASSTGRGAQAASK